MAQKIEFALEGLKDMCAIMKAYAVWSKARTEGKPKRKASAKAGKSLGDVLMGAIDAWKARKMGAVPLWLDLVRFSIQVESLLFQKKHTDVLNLLTTSSLSRGLSVDGTELRDCLAQLFRDIMDDLLQQESSLAEVRDSVGTYIEAFANSELYKKNAWMDECLEIIKHLINPASCSLADIQNGLKKAVGLKSGGDKFWMVAFQQPGGSAMRK